MPKNKIQADSPFLKLFNALLEKHRVIYSPLTKVIAVRRHRTVTTPEKYLSEVTVDNILDHRPEVKELLLEHYGDQETVSAITRRAFQAVVERKVIRKPTFIKREIQAKGISAEEVEFIAATHGFLPNETRQLMAAYKNPSSLLPVKMRRKKNRKRLQYLLPHYLTHCPILFNISATIIKPLQVHLNAMTK